MEFDEALERFAQTDPAEAEAVTELLTDDDVIDDLMTSFEAAARESDGGTEFWLARELAQLLGYKDWRNFLAIIAKARTACENSGKAAADHFVDVTRMIEIGKGGQREIADVAMTRYACYLTAQNADPRKRAVAFAQTYFAVQTRKQEIADEAAARDLSYDEKRVMLRDKLKEHNKALAEAAHTAGVETSAQFRNFMGAGIKGLYGGLSKAQIVQRKGLPPRSDHLDHAGHEELAANYFKATQAEAKLRREGRIGPKAASAAHKEVAIEVRETIKRIGGTMPEDVAAEDHIKEARRRVESAKAPALPLGDPPKKK